MAHYHGGNKVIICDHVTRAILVASCRWHQVQTGGQAAVYAGLYSQFLVLYRAVLYNNRCQALIHTLFSPALLLHLSHYFIISLCVVPSPTAAARASDHHGFPHASSHAHSFRLTANVSPAYWFLARPTKNPRTSLVMRPTLSLSSSLAPKDTSHSNSLTPLWPWLASRAPADCPPHPLDLQMIFWLIPCST